MIARAAAAIALAGLVSGCVLTEGPGGLNAGRSAEAQRAALRACRIDLFGTAPQGTRSTYHSEYRGGAVMVRLKSDTQLSAAQVVQVNDCAADRLAAGAAGYPDPEGARARAEAELTRQYFGTAATPGCPPRSSVMVGGSKYCVGTHY